MTFEVLPDAEDDETDADVSQTTDEPEGDDQEEGNEADPSPAVVEPDDVPDPETKGVQKRFDELTRLRRDAERDRDYWRELAVRKPEPQAKAAEPVQTPKTLADFGYDEAQFTAHLREQVAIQAREAVKGELDSARKQQEAQTRKQQWDTRITKYAKEVPDFHEYVTDSTPISEAMAEVIQASEDGPAVAYYLGKNQDISMAMYHLSPAQAGRELGKIEAMLVAQKSRPKPVSKAPPPPAKIEGGDPGNVEKDPSKMTDAEYAKWRNKQIAQRRA